LDEEAGPSNQRLQKSKRLLERQERCERHDAHVAEVDSDAGETLYCYNIIFFILSNCILALF
jgi:hypothetical protein